MDCKEGNIGGSQELPFVLGGQSVLPRLSHLQGLVVQGVQALPSIHQNPTGSEINSAKYGIRRRKRDVYQSS